MENQKENKPLTYDYKTVRVKRDMEAMYTDAYENLGWEVTSTTLADASLSYVNVSFKRDRKIVNKTELNKLQDEIDEVLTNIEKTKSIVSNPKEEYYITDYGLYAPAQGKLAIEIRLL